MIDTPIDAINITSVGVTYVDGRAIFKPGSKFSRVYYGICHFNEGVWAMIPSDWPKGKQIISLKVDYNVGFCDHADVCLDFRCKLNKFNKKSYEKQYDTSWFSLGLPQDIVLKSEGFTFWCNDGRWANFWKKFIIPGEGGTIEFNEEKAKRII